MAKQYNPLREDDIARLREASEWSKNRLSNFRETRRDLVDQYTGGSYGDGGESGSVPLNMMELAINIYQRQLVSHNPQVVVESSKSPLRPVAKELELAMNHLVEKELDLGKSLNEWAMDAMFMIGILKVGETSKDEAGLPGMHDDPGQPYVDTVGLEDWVHDMNARDYQEVDYAGHNYNMDYEAAMENPRFSKKGRRALEQFVRSNMQPAWDPRERPESLSGGQEWHPDDFRPKVTLKEYWLPLDNLVVTFPAEGINVPLEVKEWEGPDHGMYHLLGFASVPGNIMPLAPAVVWEDMHDLINRLFLKAADQADRQKTVLAGQNRTKNAMEGIIGTPDGHSILTDVDPNLIKEFIFGGVDPSLMGAMTQFKDLFVYMSGNLDALGGLGAQSGTLGQDKLLTQSASERLNDMQDRVVKATTQVVRDLAWYLWRNPYIDLPLTKEITPTIKRDFRWNSSQREGDFFDYNFDVVPYSLQSRSPNERLQFLLQIVQTVIMPMYPLLQQQGISFDMFKFMQMVAKLSNEKALGDLLVNDMGMTANQEGVVTPRQSPVTSRNYTRHNVPGQSRAGADQQAVQGYQQAAAAGGGPQGGPTRAGTAR